MINLKNILTRIFLYKEPHKTFDFTLPENNTEDFSSTEEILECVPQIIYPTLSVNADYIKVKYNTLINSDIKLREFKLNIKGKEYNALLLFIDGMIDSESINNFILKPIMAKNNDNIKQSPSVITNNITVKRIKKFNFK